MSDGFADKGNDATTDSWQRNRKLLLILAIVVFIAGDVLMVLWFFRVPADAAPAARPEPATGATGQALRAPQSHCQMAPRSSWGSPEGLRPPASGLSV